MDLDTGTRHFRTVLRWLIDELLRTHTGPTELLSYARALRLRATIAPDGVVEGSICAEGDPAPPAQAFIGPPLNCRMRQIWAGS